mmetsp:Transcript_100169/g.266272  ORF Transcript_100169/g.266272 Transcript_100169/m.266272 type:complete len:322 (-) Transcript_100169:202-1167(-)
MMRPQWWSRRTRRRRSGRHRQPARLRPSRLARPQRHRLRRRQRLRQRQRPRQWRRRRRWPLQPLAQGPRRTTRTTTSSGPHPAVLLSGHRSSSRSRRRLRSSSSTSNILSSGHRRSSSTSSTSSTSWCSQIGRRVHLQCSERVLPSSLLAHTKAPRPGRSQAPALHGRSPSHRQLRRCTACRSQAPALRGRSPSHRQLLGPCMVCRQHLAWCLRRSTSQRRSPMHTSRLPSSSPNTVAERIVGPQSLDCGYQHEPRTPRPFEGFRRTGPTCRQQQRPVRVVDAACPEGAAAGAAARNSAPSRAGARGQKSPARGGSHRACP